MQEITINDLSVMVVEPSSTQRKIIADNLHKLDIGHLEFCSSGSEALDAMRSRTPDLVISAMYLPDMTASEVVETMRHASDLETTPFMLISSETSFAMLDPLRQAGIIAILPKPFQIEDLRRALLATVDHISLNEQSTPDADLSELAVLIVDDSSLARKFITRVMAQLGIQNITTANDGRAAVALIENRLFDLVITDYNMPEMDGEMLTRFIREQSSQRSIPILMVTSEHEGSKLAAVQQAGISGICDKPFEVDTVRKMLSAMLEH